MCLIMHGKTSDIKKMDLKSAWRTNPHGAGITFNHKGKIHHIKGIMQLDDLQWCLSNQRSNQTIAVHLRQATHGSITTHNTHPFDAGHETYLMHNGMLYGLGKVGLNGYSDSAHLAKILQKHDMKDKIKLLSALPGKFILSTNRAFHLIGQFEIMDRVKVSNTYWSPTAFSLTNKVYGNAWKLSNCTRPDNDFDII